MIEPGTRVRWRRGDSDAQGVVAACLVGKRTSPGRTVITTLIVRIEGGGHELVPESALAPAPPPRADALGDAG